MLRILEAGYELTDERLPAGWSEGYLEDPRPSWLTFVVSNGIKICIAAIAIFILGIIGTALYLDWFSSALVGVLGFLVLFFSVIKIIITNQKSLESGGVSTEKSSVLFLKRSVPYEVRTKWVDAHLSGLFKSMRVWAPHKAFERVFTGDPLIIGYYRGRTFRIAQFDLTGDLNES